MKRIRPLLQDPPVAMLARHRFERLAMVTWLRRMKRPLQADVYLLSFPKTGRTWLRVMMGQLLAHHFGRPELADPEFAVRSPRSTGVPRIIAKHDGHPQKKTAVEINPDRREFAGCRVILLVRDLRDTVVSNYFQVTRREHRFEGELSSFLRCPRGSVDSLLRYYNSWAAQRHVPSAFHLVRYEDLHRDAPGELDRLAQFMGLRDVSISTVRAAVEHGSFGSMRARESGRPADGTPLAAGRPGDLESFKTRRGRVGGYVDYLSPDEVDWLDRRIEMELDPYFGYGRETWPGPVGG